MKNLPLHTLQKNDHLYSPQQLPVISLQSPALSVLNTLRIDSHIPAVLARDSLLSEEVSAKLVVNAEHQLIGVITRAQLSEQNILRVQASNRQKRTELLVSDVMIPRSLLHAVELQVLQQASIADVIAALRKAGEDQLLVLDGHNHEIHGMLVMSDISQRLHMPLINEKALAL